MTTDKARFPNGTVDHASVIALEVRDKRPGHRWTAWNPTSVATDKPVGLMFAHSERVAFVTLTLASGRAREYRRL